MDQKTRKLIAIHKVLHPRGDVNRLYVSSKEERRRIASIEDCVDTSMRRLESNIEKRSGKLIRATRNNTGNTRISKTKITKTKREEKQLYRHFKRQTSEISHEKTWWWLIKGNFKRETESLPIAEQNNAIRTNYVKTKIDETQQYS